MTRSIRSLTPNQRELAGFSKDLHNIDSVLSDILEGSRFIGFDNLIRDASSIVSQKTGYPPHNVVQFSEDSYVVELAVAGFSPEEIEVTVEDNRLTVAGRTISSEEDSHGLQYLHRGIAKRAFEMSFKLGEHHEVGEAKITNGILTIPVNRVVPDEKKPKKIPISSG